MLIHRKNWCRICGICLSCPRTRKSIFQHGDCHCPERQANHVPPKRVKGEKLFSFRYRHLSAEDIDILSELRPRFKFPTPPIERNLVRANICSTCQQRLRRARILRRHRSAPEPYPDADNAISDGSSSDPNGDNSDYSGAAALRISHLVEAAALSQTQLNLPSHSNLPLKPPPHSRTSALRSTLYHQSSQPRTSAHGQHPDSHSLWQHPMSSACPAADAMHREQPAAQKEQPTYAGSLENKGDSKKHATAAAHSWSPQSQTNSQAQQAAETPSNERRFGKLKDMREQGDDGFDELDITHVDHEVYQEPIPRPYPMALLAHPEDRNRTSHSGQIVYGYGPR